MKKISALATLLALLATSFGAANASAQGPWAPLGGYGGFAPYGTYAWQRDAFDRVPYYAMHPPVYYSYPVARPYGYSPFALPPGVLPVEPNVAPDCLAQVESNPFFVPGEKAPAPAAPAAERSTKTAVAAPEINPFFVRSELRPAVESVAKNER